ncbi:hypothetical protein [Streptomyces sp. JH34]|uniref:hypothetical protein n=1 Tax=Streptomyces sp. JH34 TaxID=2793633 RepID=UPI0023F705A2|nr:hypothetical protein [Streptomyces sp. JH34]MDF6016938.1 hypothetical protein [Streptomyces sp. JH34]
MVVSVMALECLRQAPASASGTAEDGPVGIGVVGAGLKVREVRKLLDGWENGARARVTLWQRGSYVRTGRGWKATGARETRGHRFEYAAWKINKSFPHRSQLCVEYTGHDRMRCVTIKR